MTTPQERRIERLETVIHPSDAPPDLSRLTPDEQRELEAILVHVLPGDLTGLTDDELDRLRALTIRAGGA